MSHQLPRQSTPTARARQDLAINGGTPIRSAPLPYAMPTVDDRDREAVMESLRTGWLTQGPAVARFEKAFAEHVGAAFAVAVSNGTAALHAMLACSGIGSGDEVITTPLTFVASANAILYCGATPVFADIDPATLCLSAESVAARISKRTKAILAVDYAGQPCDYDAIAALCEEHGISLFVDAAHSLGATYRGRRAGTLARASTFSFHPAKHMSTGEGGAITTDDEELAQRLRWFRNHGITTDAREREKTGATGYDMKLLGFNYRLSDMQCALGQAQLLRQEAWLGQRRKIASQYDASLSALCIIMLPQRTPESSHAHHLYPVIVREGIGLERDLLIAALRAEGITCAVHYKPVHLHSYYLERFPAYRGTCPVAEEIAQRVLSLPMFHGMSEQDAADVVAALHKLDQAFGI